MNEFIDEIKKLMKKYLYGVGYDRIRTFTFTSFTYLPTDFIN